VIKKKAIRFIALNLVVIFTVTMGLGIWIGISYNKFKKIKETFVENYAIENAKQKFADILTLLSQNYVNDVNLDTLSNMAITQMLGNLDLKCLCLTSDELASQISDSHNEVGMTGIKFTIINGKVYVITAFNGSSADEAGIRANDLIVKIDDVDIIGKSITDMFVQNKLNGPVGSNVRVSIKRNGENELLHFDIKRDNLIPCSMVGYMVNPEIGCIKINKFTSNSHKLFKSILKNLQAKGMKKMVMDLRNNPSDDIDKAIRIAGKLLQRGYLISYSKGKLEKYNVKYYARSKDIFDKCPIIVLIDSGSASAAEVLAGALQDNDRAYIVGQKSFGIANVQLPMQLRDDSHLLITVAKYYTPSGRCIQKIGSESKQKDNVALEESLKCHTSMGRIIMDDGGITPDYIINPNPYIKSNYLNKVKTIIRQYANTYVNNHTVIFMGTNCERFKNEFEVTKLMIDQIRSQAISDRLFCDDSEFNTISPTIKLYIKAYIANKIWKEEGYYTVINTEDNVFQKSITLFDEATTLIKSLVPEEE